MAAVFYERLKEDCLFIGKNYYDKVVPIKPLSPAEKLKFGNEKVCHICERSLDVLPPMLVKQILTTKNAIQYYKSLDNDGLVNEYMEKLEKAKKNLKINKEELLIMII